MTTSHPITDAWRPLARHAEACVRCAVAVARLARVPEDPSRSDGAEHEILCEDGREAFAAWWQAKHELLEAKTALRRRQFIMRDQLWDDGVTFEARAAAIMSMPGPDFQAWLELPDDRRHAQLRALEATRAGWSESTVVREQAVTHESTGAPERGGKNESTDVEERVCAAEGCGVRFVPEFERQRYHSAACRARVSRARRRLESTE